MGRKIFVGGLPWATDEDGLRAAFAEYGEITYAKVVTDRDTGRSKGFGFVEFDTDQAAQDAIAGMDGQDLGGRRVRVNEAHEKKRDSGPPRDRRPPPRDRYESRPAVIERPSHWPSPDDQGGRSQPKRQGSSKRRRDNRWDNDGF